MTIFKSSMILEQMEREAVPSYSPLLKNSASRHHKLCPKQVLGVRMGLFGAELLGLGLPNLDKRLLVILETDGCFADGVEVATGCTIGHRTLRVEDYGKVAASFVDTTTGEAIRLVPNPDVRYKARFYASQTHNRYLAQLEGYQIMPSTELFEVQNVLLSRSIQEIINSPGSRVLCESCGEEIMNGREIQTENGLRCRACSGEVYYVYVVQ